MIKQLLILSLIILPPSVSAGDFFDDDAGMKTEKSKLSLELNGFTRGVFFAGKKVENKGTEVKAGYGELGLKCRPRIGKFGDGYAELRYRYGSEFGKSITEFNLREAYVNTYLGKLDVRLGHQIVVWGRADAFNPTNNITPQNMTARSADEDDRKVGNFLLRSSYDFGPMDFELIWVPKYTSSVLPSDLFPFPDGVAMGTADLPDASLGNGSIALKTSVVLGSFDGSASWFRGYMPTPGIVFSHGGIDDSNRIIIVLKQKPHISNVLGADFSTSVRSFGLRGEFAYRRPIDNFKLNDKFHSYIPNPDFQYLLGVDKSIGNFSVIVQYVGRYVSGFESEPDGNSQDIELELTNRMITSQQDMVSHAFLIRPDLSLFHETVTLEFLSYFNISTDEFLLRPSLIWNIADALTLKAGYEGYSGPDGTLFGNIKDALSSLFVEIKVSF